MSTKMLAAFGVMALICACATYSLAARSAPKNQKTASDIKTEFFSVRLPEGWNMPQHVKKQPGDNGISAAFVKGNLAITITIIKAAADARELAEEVAKNMRQSGLKTSAPTEDNGLWRIDISGRAQGRAWFGSADALSGITLVLGPDIERANEFLSQLKPVSPGLIPKSVK